MLAAAGTEKMAQVLGQSDLIRGRPAAGHRGTVAATVLECLRLVPRELEATLLTGKLSSTERDWFFVTAAVLYIASGDGWEESTLLIGPNPVCVINNPRVNTSAPRFRATLPKEGCHGDLNRRGTVWVKNLQCNARCKPNKPRQL